MEDGDSKWNVLSREVTPAQIITAIIVGAILLLLVILNILVYISYRQAVKSYAQIIERNKNMAANFQTKMAHLFHRKRQDLDESNASGTSTASRAHSRSSEADTLPRKQSLDNNLIENQIIPEFPEQKHKSILKHHPEPESTKSENEQQRKNSSPHIFGFLHKSDDKHFTKHDGKKKHHHGHYSPALIKANTKKNSQRLSKDWRSLSVDNLHQDLGKIHHHGPAKRVSLVASETQLEDIAHVSQRHHQHGSSPLATDNKMADSTTYHTGHVHFKDDRPVKTSVSVTSVTPPSTGMTHPTLSTNYVRSHQDLHNRHEQSKGNNSHHSTKVIVSDLTHIDIKGQNSTIKTTYPTSNVAGFSKIPTSISKPRSQHEYSENLEDNSRAYPQTKGKHSSVLDINKDNNSQIKLLNSTVPVRISDFHHIQPESDTPVLIRVTSLNHNDSKEDNSKFKGSNFERIDSVMYTQTITEIHDTPAGDDDFTIEENVSTDTIGSDEAAMMAKKNDDYREIEIVDTTSISRLRRPRSDDTEPVVEFQNLAFEKSDKATDLGTFYVGDVEL